MSIERKAPGLVWPEAERIRQAASERPGRLEVQPVSTLVLVVVLEATGGTGERVSGVAALPNETPMCRGPAPEGAGPRRGIHERRVC